MPAKKSTQYKNNKYYYYHNPFCESKEKHTRIFVQLTLHCKLLKKKKKKKNLFLKKKKKKILFYKKWNSASIVSIPMKGDLSD